MSQNLSETVFETFSKRPDVAILMSGSGSNAAAILNDEKIRSYYEFSSIVTDNPNSNAKIISQEHNLTYIEAPIDKFKDFDSRVVYFDNLRDTLQARGVSNVIYAGFMKITTPSFCEALPGLNIHPADLSIIGTDGSAKYRGMRALNEMRQELGFVRSTVHVVDNPVDSGAAISLSDTVVPDIHESDQETHRLLKEKEHFIYTATLKLLGMGVLSLNETPYEATKIKELLSE